MAGANLTWLDFYFGENLIFLDKVSDGLILAQNPVLRDYLDRFMALPGVQNSIDDINAKQMAFNYPSAKLLGQYVE